MQKNSLVRTIYLYLFSLVGLALITIGIVRFVDLALKVYIFKKAEQAETYRQMPAAIPSKAMDSGSAERLKVDEDLVKQWEQDYKTWREEQSKIDYLSSSRQQTASNSLAMIIIGLPLYLYHWRIIRRETKEMVFR